MTPRKEACALVLGALLFGAPRTALAVMPDLEGENPRKTTPKDLQIEVEKLALENGLVVLLAPDPSASSVVVDMSFRAGAAYEPPGKSGLAHFVEHLILRGPTPATDYIEMLERRRVRELNAFTSAELMLFRAVVPPEELPIALWIDADRLLTVPALLDRAPLENHRRVIAEERAERELDVPFGRVDLEIDARIHPVPHPLHASVIGDPEELAKITLEDARAFIAAHLHASNAILTLAGRFEAAQAKQWIEETVAKLPAAPRPQRPPPPKTRPEGMTITVTEELSRRPRVTVLWKLPEITDDTADALELGALLLSNYVDGAYGTEVSAQLEGDGPDAVFRLDVTLPYEKPIESAAGEAEVFLRYLTGVDMPRNIFNGTRLARDRATLFTLDTLKGRARILTALEYALGDPTKASSYTARHWRFARHTVQHIAWKSLITGPPRIVVHARPVKMKQAKLNWDER